VSAEAGGFAHSHETPLPVPAAAVAEEPGATVFAHERFADWLVLAQPQLAGRIAYDARFELLPPSKLGLIARFRDQRGPRWKRAADGFRIIVLGAEEHSARKSVLAESGTRELYGDASLVVIERQRGGS
jgi:hypothetical protein